MYQGIEEEYGSERPTRYRVVVLTSLPNCANTGSTEFNFELLKT